MEIPFATDYASVLAKMDQIDPVKYGKTRNYVNGDVTYLSPYISRGVISTKQVLEHVLAKGTNISQIEPFAKELCWRDYFQRVGQVKDLHQEIRQPQQPVLHQQIPVEIIQANTGITGIDLAIQHLYRSGYMHNHCRMYTASVVCNVAKSHWLHPAQWMYYHLLDGDWASNACSWQWVAGANSSKKYYANQENINKYTSTSQTNTWLDISYEAIEEIQIPNLLLATQSLLLETALPEAGRLQINHRVPTFIFTYYNLDPTWHAGETGNRILLLEPDFFQTYPISRKCIEFMLALGANIPGLQIHIGSFESLAQEFKIKNMYYKEHPLQTGYSGTEEARDWIAEEVTGYYPSFFSYWKKVEKQLLRKYS